MRIIAPGVLTVLLAAAAYDGAVALGWIAVGPAPGQRPAGAGPVQAAALLALLAGAVRRMSEAGAVSGTWVLALAGVALVAAALTGLRPRVGLAVSGLTLLLSAVTALWMGTGH